MRSQRYVTRWLADHQRSNLVVIPPPSRRLPALHPPPTALSSACRTAALQGISLADVARECGVATETQPPLPPLDWEVGAACYVLLADPPCTHTFFLTTRHTLSSLQKYQCHPEPVTPPPIVEPAGGGRRPFSLLRSLLEQVQAQPAGDTAEAAAAAAAVLLLLDEPLLHSGQEQGSNSLREGLEHLAATCFEAGSQLDGSAIVSLRELALPGAQVADTQPSRHPAAPKPVHLEVPPPASMLPAFLLLHAGPRAAAAADTGAGAASQPPPTAAADSLFVLEAPVLPAAGAARGAGLVVGAPTSAFAQLFQPVAVPPPAPPPPACLVPEGCRPASLAALLAQDMELEGGSLMLPPVQLDGEEGGSIGEAPLGGGSGGGRGIAQLVLRNCAPPSLSHPHAALPPPEPLPQPRHCWRLSRLTAAASPPAPPTWRSISTGGRGGLVGAGWAGWHCRC